MRNMIVASTSTVFGSSFLEYLLPDLIAEFTRLEIKELLFVPYARPGGISHDMYTEKVQNAFSSYEVKVRGIHEFDDPVDAIEHSRAIYTGGGNTFRLVKMLHDLELMTSLRKAIYNGAFYIGTSAGSNICGLNMRTTNDMPIVQPSSFKTTGTLGYNINPHYLDPVDGDTHMGETREQRIAEFHCYNNIPVVGLREGSYIRVIGDEEALKGSRTARVFTRDNQAIEVAPGYDFAQLT